MLESAEADPLPEEPEDDPEPAEEPAEEDPEVSFPDELEPEPDEVPEFPEALPEEDEPPFEEPEDPEPELLLLDELDELDESALEDSPDWEEPSFDLVDVDSFEVASFAAPLLAEELCFAWDASLAVNMGSVFSPMPRPSVNTWMSPAEITMAIKAETTETIITLR